MKITTQKALGLRNGLLALDGYQRSVKDGEGERVITEFYKLGAVRQTIAINLNRLEPICSGHDRAKDGLIKELAPGQIKLPDDKIAAFVPQYQMLLDTEHDVVLTPISYDDLNLDENPISVGVLSLLNPILTEDKAAPAKKTEKRK